MEKDSLICDRWQKIENIKETEINRGKGDTIQNSSHYLHQKILETISQVTITCNSLPSRNYSLYVIIIVKYLILCSDILLEEPVPVITVIRIGARSRPVLPTSVCG